MGKMPQVTTKSDLVKNDVKLFWRFIHFSETMGSLNLNQGVLQTLDHRVSKTIFLLNFCGQE